MLKRGLRVAAQLTPISAALAQFWSELDSEELESKVRDLEGTIEALQNPLQQSHTNASTVLSLFYDLINKTEDPYQNQWSMDDNLLMHRDVLSLWGKNGLVSISHAIGRRWISITLDNPNFILEIYAFEHGAIALAKLKIAVWEMIKGAGVGMEGYSIAEKLGVKLLYVDSIFYIFDSEGKGHKSPHNKSSYFSPLPELCGV